MTRYFVLGNNDILVGMDINAQVRDFYFPHVGQENHVNNQTHRIGLWVNGIFSWMDGEEWHKKRAYSEETLSTNNLFINNNLQIELRINDCVHHQSNILIRKFIIKNLSSENKEVRLFFHQDFTISEANIGDTVYYNPLIQSIIHYKGKRYFLVNGQVNSKGIAEWATGLAGEYGREGTYKDAEDGILSNNPIEHGSVDSTIAFHTNVSPNKSKECYYWVAVGETFEDVEKLNSIVLAKGASNLILETENYWKKWVNQAKFNFFDLNQNIVNLFKRSLLVVQTHLDRHGAIIASSDSEMLHLKKDTYNYFWPRDGALIARSIDRAGYYEITEHFFKFCYEVLTKDGYMFHKYRPDGSLGSSWHPWLNHGHIQLPIQEDEIALVLDAFWKHYLQHGEKNYIRHLHQNLIRKAAEFMIKFIDKKTGLPMESYDLWEEKLGIHTFTCATVYAGLTAAARLETEFGAAAKAKQYNTIAETIKAAILKHLYDEDQGYFIKSIYYDQNKIVKDLTLDLSSFYAVFEYGILAVDDVKLARNLKLIQDRLLNRTNIGGYARYENDNYYRIDRNTPGNPWFITTLWLAEYYIKKAKTQDDLKPALDIFEWAASHALDTGILPEQLNPHDGSPVSVAPLTWSHAAFVIAINKYLEKLDQMGICKMCNPPLIKKDGGSK
ncbi:MAG TPA: glycoside hydrolase family 15 protein [Candidatus Nanoarchaeia archaeon]|nr:glycoside hydrolase family 15 protein [Candidatus Nanoarchaeia archaeon]